MTQYIPKAELHTHLEGTIPAKKALELSRRNGIELPKGIIKNDQYQWSDFLEMIIKCYDGVANTLRTEKDYYEITYEYLERSAGEGSLYTEIIISHDHIEAVGLSYKDGLMAITRAMDAARQEFGIESRLQAVIVRHHGVEEAFKAVETILGNPHPYITGVNLAGDEINFPARYFKEIFRLTERSGLPASIHAGEAVGPRSIWEAIDDLGATRIGHGVRCIEDDQLVERLARDQILLEVAPSSNVEIGVFPSYQAHPLRELYDRGINVTINSDDPPFFFTTLGREYQIAADHFGFTHAELIQTTRNAINGAFIDTENKKILLKKLESYQEGAPQNDQKKYL